MSVKYDKHNLIDAESFAELTQSRSESGSNAGSDQQAESAQQQQLIPPGFKVLFVSEVRPVWVSLALRLDATGCSEPRFEWVSTAEEALTQLRKDSFDCLLIQFDEVLKKSRLELLNAIRISGCHEPVVLLLSHPDDQVTLAACENQAEILVSPAMWESPALLSVVRRALFVQQLTEENHQLQVDKHRRLIRERDEAERLLNQQRSIVEELQTLVYPDAINEMQSETAGDKQTDPHKSDAAAELPRIPFEVRDYYHELLRTYVIMGAGSLKDEILQIAELLAAVDLTPPQVLEFHLECVELIVKGLGNRSSRHVMSRADLLALEMMVHLGECYQKKNGN
ncbi:hypothetical protein [Gimesia sp.]|uniref:hypothetical protein n=1 Tax=Gimesia sp. TaxID=2024833 RepID=UPI000C570ADC|nr:hypothetical protein [Gimesia sp.]MAX37282.1 hypothetical protein [Gimesia sp.]HAH48233.1 hypothetical protein [Planctomycetaceae bacterium]HBL43038.1 hypothetical protein [Planctomycetaceae bacterium]|tara:strand:- start:13004 stop:14020 length:1017 start_codon:yes stop_codon:yes gene_type:complete